MKTLLRTVSGLLFLTSLAAPQLIPVNQQAPDISGKSWLNSPAGPLSLSSLKGKVTIVEFWTFSCINCQHNLEAYNRLYNRFHPEGVELIGIHTPETAWERDPKRVAAALQKWNIHYPNLIDADHSNWDRWKQEFWPAIYLIDKQGKIRYRWEGELNYGKTNGEEQLSEQIQKLNAE